MSGRSNLIMFRCPEAETNGENQTSLINPDFKKS